MQYNDTTKLAPDPPFFSRLPFCFSTVNTSYDHNAGIIPAAAGLEHMKSTEQKQNFSAAGGEAGKHPEPVQGKRNRALNPTQSSISLDFYREYGLLKSQRWTLFLFVWNELDPWSGRNKLIFKNQEKVLRTVYHGSSHKSHLHGDPFFAEGQRQDPVLPPTFPLCSEQHSPAPQGKQSPSSLGQGSSHTSSCFVEF